MTIPNFARAALGGVAAVLLSLPAFAGAGDYTFEPVKVDVMNGAGSQLAVRMIHKPTGKPVVGAVLFRTLLDMSPDKMDSMTAKHAAMPTAEPGVYAFKADFTMAGDWAFKIQAKVPGEAETVTGTVIFQAK